MIKNSHHFLMSCWIILIMHAAGPLRELTSDTIQKKLRGLTHRAQPKHFLWCIKLGRRSSQIHADKNFLFLDPKNLRQSASKMGFPAIELILLRETVEIEGYI